MKVYSDPNKYNNTSTVVTLGMFDGVHLGHKQLLSKVVTTARNIDARSVVVTFWPHPRLVLGKNAEDLKFITTLDEKIALLEKEGIDDLILLPFNLELAALSAKEFIEQVLIAKFGMQHLIMGYNHRFGKDRIDDYSVYQSIANENQFGISKVEAVKVGSVNVSSTVVRNAIETGDVVLAKALLSYTFSLTGNVVSGQQLGRTIGFPTANIEPNDSHKIIPQTGVYACRLLVKGNKYDGMLNVGIKPTVSSKTKQTIEVHIFNFSDDIYSEEVVIEFVDRVRNEQKFESVDALKAQLKIDEQTVKKLLS
ncbi:bifunctional riboflavin kinase/FAD synthetase [Saccharicrinis aurantiacus]|uniref:bifunctional riboflavin kinase/FAD synthetase n=1 Tax=Saccharicrinis aurantiacus TaxID=1849719 RepID=UPI002492D467|nr:bifunctional riboflavin kinase/FAD synthetase [Saccharicrinis aurantiacus]